MVSENVIVLMDTNGYLNIETNGRDMNMIRKLIQNQLKDTVVNSNVMQVIHLILLTLDVMNKLPVQLLHNLIMIELIFVKLMLV